jgi:hypothetical protein
MKYINTENSKEHWEFIKVDNRIILDLGCGRWNKVECVEDSWLSTPEHFVINGATKVVGVDTDPAEIEWFNNKFGKDSRYNFILQNISSVDDLKKLYSIFNPNCVKCDIEGNEKYLYKLDKDIFCSVDEYYIETHGDNLYSIFISLFAEYGYSIREQIDLTHTNGFCKVIFAYK